MPFNFVESLTGLVGSAVSNMLWNSILNADKSTSSTKTPTTQDQYNTKYQQVSSPAVKSSANSFSNSFVGVDAEKLPDFDKLIKQNDIRLGRSFADFEDMITSFNVSRLPNFDATPMPFVGHIIMSRPSLYVDIGSGSVTGGTASEGSPNPKTNFAAMKSHPKTSAFVNDKYGQLLLNMLSYKSSSNYMPLFTTQAMTYQVGDVGLETVKTGETFSGHTIKYGHYTEEHKLGGTISIDFRNDYYYSVLKTIYIWMMYIDIVSRGDAILPSLVSQLNGILDYCASIYYLVTDAGMSRLLYWEKLTGVFPKTAPFSIFNYNDAPAIEDKISVEFDYGMRSDPCDPNVLFDLNMLSGGSYQMAAKYMQYGPAYQYSVKSIDYSDRSSMKYWNKSQRPDSFRGPFGLGDAFAAKPIIQAVKSGNTLNYYLYWLKS